MFLLQGYLPPRAGRKRESHPGCFGDGASEVSLSIPFFRVKSSARFQSKTFVYNGVSSPIPALQTQIDKKIANYDEYSFIYIYIYIYVYMYVYMYIYKGVPTHCLPTTDPCRLRKHTVQ